MEEDDAQENVEQRVDEVARLLWTMRPTATP